MRRVKGHINVKRGSGGHLRRFQRRDDSDPYKADDECWVNLSSGSFFQVYVGVHYGWRLDDDS